MDNQPQVDITDKGNIIGEQEDNESGVNNLDESNIIISGNQVDNPLEYNITDKANSNFVVISIICGIVVAIVLVFGSVFVIRSVKKRRIQDK